MINQNKFKKVFHTIELGVSSLIKSIPISPELEEREKVLAGEGVGSDAHTQFEARRLYRRPCGTF